MSVELKYRKRIYPTYTTINTPEAIRLDPIAIESDVRFLLYRLKDWLPLHKDAVCLDVGCGTGLLLYALKSKGYQNVSGVDCSPEQVKVAQRFCLNVEQDDAIEYLRRANERFELITALDIIEHLDKNEVINFLDVLYGALKPGGRLILQTPNADSIWHGSLRYGDFTHETAFTPGSLVRLLKIAGFSKFEVRECGPIVHGFRSMVRAALWKLIRTGLIVWNMIETGCEGSGVYTRVFIASAEKPMMNSNKST